MPAGEISKAAEPTVCETLPLLSEVPQAPETPPPAETEVDTEELPALLEEVLWSAILLTRGAAGRKLESTIAEDGPLYAMCKNEVSGVTEGFAYPIPEQRSVCKA